MPLVELQRGDTVRNIHEACLWKRYPDAVAGLLLRLWRSDSPRHVWYKGKELVVKLLGTEIPPELAQGLRELAAEAGWSEPT